MTDARLMQTYMAGLYMLSLLNEWNKIERIGVVAKIHNTITKKHNAFHLQHLEVESGKKKKYSKKCELFIRASAYAISVWEKVINETKDTTLVVNTAMHNLFRLNAEDFNRIYGLTEEDFRKLDNNRKHNLILQSCRVARLLNENSVKLLDRNSETVDIYKLLHKGK